jgi:hypothetical protein
MRSRWAELLVAAGALSGAPSIATAQQGTEIGAQAIGTASDPGLAVLGGYAALRTSSRTRLSATLGAGVMAEELAWRGEALLHFLVSPARLRGPGFYLAGGLAAVEGPVSRGYLVLTLGLEDRPGAESGWAVELGVGGGPRLGLAYRWRQLRARP